MANEHLLSTDKPASKRAGWNPKFDMLFAAVFLLGAEAIYSVCLLQGGLFDGFEDPAYVLAKRSIGLTLALSIAVVIGLLLSKGLSDAGGWRKAALAALIAPYVVSVLRCAFNDPCLLDVVPINMLEVTFWPMLLAVLSRVLFSGKRSLGLASGTALFFALGLVFIAVATCLEPYQHDYIEFILMAVASIGTWFFAVGGAKRLGGRGWAVLALAAAGLVAAWLALVMDFRFWDILGGESGLGGEPGYTGIWLADRLESVQRFFSFSIEGWDALPERNALFLVASIAGPVVAAVYAAMPVVSAAFMVHACGKLARRMQARFSAPGALSIAAYGVAYSAYVILALASNLLNITTSIAIVHWLGGVPASIMLIVLLLGGRAFDNPENLPENDAADAELSGCEARVRASTAEEAPSDRGDVENPYATSAHHSFPSTIWIKEA